MPSWLSGAKSLVRPVASLRTKNHAFTRFEVFNERNYAQKVPYVIPPFILFGILDGALVPSAHWYFFPALRLAAVGLSAAGFYLARDRCRYATRVGIAVAPYILVVEHILLTNHLQQTSYASGLALVIFSAAVLFPLRFAQWLFLMTVTLSPLLLYSLSLAARWEVGGFLDVFMASGLVLLSSIGSQFVRSGVEESFRNGEQLARNRGQRGEEILRKAGELVTAKHFETQFSPQVRKALKASTTPLDRMVQRKLCNVVVDIEDSTEKADVLEAEDYRRTVQSVVDLVVAQALKWNVTVDRFTGDGIQAFTGAPLSGEDDLHRAVRFALDAVDVVYAAKSELQTLWRGELRIRISIVQGNALVGFLGKGTMRFYTAIGSNISLAHRLNEWCPPWSVLVYAEKQGDWTLPFSKMNAFERISAVGLKGFGLRRFECTSISPRFDSGKAHLLTQQECETCSTLMVLGETSLGLPEVYCPACRLSGSAVRLA